jgi:hypothetical protein
MVAGRRVAVLIAHHFFLFIALSDYVCEWGS